MPNVYTSVFLFLRLFVAFRQICILESPAALANTVEGPAQTVQTTVTWIVFDFEANVRGYIHTTM